MTSFAEHFRDECRNLTAKFSRGRGRESYGLWSWGGALISLTSMLDTQPIAYSLHLSKAMKSKQRSRKASGLVCSFWGKYPCQEVGGTVSQVSCLGSATAAAGAAAWKELEFVCMTLVEVKRHFLEGLRCTSRVSERNSPPSTVCLLADFCLL